MGKGKHSELQLLFPVVGKKVWIQNRRARETIHNAKPSAKIQRRQKDTQKMLLEIAALRRGREKRCLRKIRMWRGGEREKREEGKERERTDGLYRCGEFFFRVVCEKKSEK